MDFVSKSLTFGIFIENLVLYSAVWTVNDILRNIYPFLLPNRVYIDQDVRYIGQCSLELPHSLSAVWTINDVLRNIYPFLLPERVYIYQDVIDEPHCM